ncbi:hypothetical protein S245_047721, partial [Arachis hypogaea]
GIQSSMITDDSVAKIFFSHHACVRRREGLPILGFATTVCQQEFSSDQLRLRWDPGGAVLNG